MVAVTLRPLEDRDLERVYAWERDPDSVRQAAFTRKHPDDRAAFDAHYARVRGDADVILRAVVVEGDVVATVGSFTMEGDREVTYWVDPTRRGRGIATAALSALLALDGTRPIFARVAEHNAASAAVLMRCGFTAIGSERSFANGFGCEVTEIIYRLG